MADQDGDNPEAARGRLVTLLEGDDWEISQRARREGKLVLRWLRDREPTDAELVQYVLSVLKAHTAIRCAPQGDPPGSTGIAWQMTDARNIFIKLRMQGGFGQPRSEEYVYIQSIHQSIHP